MTAHPIDTEALRAEIEAAVTDYQRVFPSPQKLAPNLALAVRALSALAAAEHRATRAEAQAAIRGRAVAVYQQRAREAEARIKAVEDVLDHHDAMVNSFNVPAHRIRRALGGDNGV